MNRAKPFALHYGTDASPSSDGSAFFFCCASFSGELYWRQFIIEEGREEFKRSLLELWKWDCFLLSEVWIHLSASLVLRNHFHSQTGSAGCTWVGDKGAICVKAICFDGRCPRLTISRYILAAYFPFLSLPWRLWQGMQFPPWCFFLDHLQFLSVTFSDNCSLVSLFPM